jgi:DNA-binding CsgD family transcriptional regulator
VARPSEINRARARIAQICESWSEGASVPLRQDLLEVLGEVIDFDAYVWVLTDPATAVGAAPLADVPADLVAELPQVIRLKYLTEVNRWTLPGFTVDSLHRSTGGDLPRSRLWRELLVRYGIVDVASAVFRDRHGCWAFLDLWRGGDNGVFADADLNLLSSVNAEITAVLRRCQAASFMPGAEGRPLRTAPAVLLLSAELQVVGQTPETLEYLRRLIPPARGAYPVPAGAYHVAAQLLSIEAGVDLQPAVARVQLPAGRWLTLRADRVDGEVGTGEVGIGEAAFAVTIEEASAAERVDLFARAFGLTHREQELLQHLLEGPDTRTVAGLMFLSEHTVQDHLKSIFDKVGVRSRRELVSRALGV